MTLGQLRNAVSGDFLLWLDDRRNRRTAPYRMEKCGYAPVRNESSFTTQSPESKLLVIGPRVEADVRRRVRELGKGRFRPTWPDRVELAKLREFLKSAGGDADG